MITHTKLRMLPVICWQIMVSFLQTSYNPYIHQPDDFYDLIVHKRVVMIYQ